MVWLPPGDRARIRELNRDLLVHGLSLRHCAVAARQGRLCQSSAFPERNCPEKWGRCPLPPSLQRPPLSRSSPGMRVRCYVSLFPLGPCLEDGDSALSPCTDLFLPFPLPLAPSLPNSSEIDVQHRQHPGRVDTSGAQAELTAIMAPVRQLPGSPRVCLFAFRLMSLSLLFCLNLLPFSPMKSIPDIPTEPLLQPPTCRCGDRGGCPACCPGPPPPVAPLCHLEGPSAASVSGSSAF